MQVENLRQSNLEMKETIEEKDAEMAEYMATMGQVKPYSSMNFFNSIRSRALVEMDISNSIA